MADKTPVHPTVKEVNPGEKFVSMLRIGRIKPRHFIFMRLEEGIQETCRKAFPEAEADDIICVNLTDGALSFRSPDEKVVILRS